MNKLSHCGFSTKTIERSVLSKKSSLIFKRSCRTAKTLIFPKTRESLEKIDPILKKACSQAYPKSAICVQRFDDSLNSAIRITYRISLRSSSLREPRYPLLRVVFFVFVF